MVQEVTSGQGGGPGLKSKGLGKGGSIEKEFFEKKGEKVPTPCSKRKGHSEALGRGEARHLVDGGGPIGK